MHVDCALGGEDDRSVVDGAGVGLRLTAGSSMATVLVGVLEWLLFLHHAPVRRGWRCLGAADGGGGGV